MTPRQHPQATRGAAPGSGRATSQGRVGCRVAATCHAAAARRAAVARTAAAPGLGGDRGVACLGASRLAGEDGLPAGELRPPAMRRRGSLITDFLYADRLKSRCRKGVDLCAGERPWRPFIGILVRVARPGDDQERATGRDEVANVCDRLPTGRIRQGLQRQTLHHQVKGTMPGSRRARPCRFVGGHAANLGHAQMPGQREAPGGADRGGGVA